jgi:glutamine synthetase
LNDQCGKVIAEYIWIDGTGISLRSKCRTLDKKINYVEEIPIWNFDGSSTYQATIENSEIILKPVAFYRDPFRGGDNILVLCETFMWEDTTYAKQIPSNTNFRHFAVPIWDAKLEEEPMYGIE